MANNAESKNGYVNYNLCRSFNQNIKTSLTMLTGANGGTILPALTGGHPCSEITIWNRTGSNLTVFDNEYAADFNGFQLSAGEQFTFRGLTNVAQVSAIAVSAGKIYYRAQYYSSNPSR